MNDRTRFSLPCRCSGFTLLEVVTVLVIVTIVAAIAMPRYHDAAVRYQAEMAARRIAADLHMVRADARATGQARTVHFHAANHRYSVQGIAPWHDASQPYVVDLVEPPYKATLHKIDLHNNQVTFNAYGLPEEGGSIAVQSGKYVRTVKLDPDTGLANVE